MYQMATKAPSLLWTTTTVLIILVGSSLAIRDPEVFYADEAVSYTFPPYRSSCAWLKSLECNPDPPFLARPAHAIAQPLILCVSPESTARPCEL